jgi:2-methylcitrate dehydratase PrpD
MSAESLTRRIAHAALALPAAAIPVAVQEKMQQLLADTLVVAAPGRVLPSSRALVAALPKAPGFGRIWFDPYGARYAAADAAFINCLHAGALDFDSLNQTVHADLIVLPAAWTMAEQLGRSPAELLHAYTIACELVSRLARGSSSPSRGWSPTALFGGLGAALVSGLLMRLDEERLQHALGLAFVQAAGTQQANVEKTLAKRLQPAFAVRAGVVAAQLAAAGATGPALALEGPFGLRALYQPGDDQAVLEGWAEQWQVLDTQIKPFPVCACSHAAVQALLDLLAEQGIEPAHVQSIEAVISPFMQRLVGGDFSLNGDLQVVAQFNLRYHLASTLLRGPLTLEHLHEQALRDPAISDLLPRIQLTVDEHNANELAPATVRLTLLDGRHFEQTCTALPGSASRPLSASAWQDKAQACLQAGEAQVDANQFSKALACFGEAGVIQPVWNL